MCLASVQVSDWGCTQSRVRVVLSRVGRRAFFEPFGFAGRLGQIAFCEKRENLYSVHKTDLMADR